MASALGVELVIEARDKVGRVIYTPLDMTEQVAGTSLGWISTGVSTF